MTGHHAKVLIVGCPRSGTMYTAMLLQALGLDVRHEAAGSDGAVSWRERKGKPFAVEFEHTFHQVRAPLHTIASMLTLGPPAWRYADRTVPELDSKDSTLRRSMQLWYYMNRRFEQVAEWTFRIEAIDVVLPELCKRLGVRFSGRALKRIPRNVNTREHWTVGWSELFAADPPLTRRIMDLAERYGYEHWPEDMHRVGRRRR